MFTCALSGVQDLALCQHNEKKTLATVSAFKLFVASDLDKYATKAYTKTARKFS